MVKHDDVWGCRLVIGYFCVKTFKVINILDGMFRHVVEKQYLYMIFEES